MKGCVTIWLVWVRHRLILPLLSDAHIRPDADQCSFTLLERIFDGILSIFVPFYNELKALVIIFQLVFRAAVRP